MTSYRVKYQGRDYSRPVPAPRVSPQHARWERPKGEPSLLVGEVIILAGFALIVGAVALFGGIA